MDVREVAATYAAAAHSFADLVRRVPADRFAGPGLGSWDLRALVGHTSRSLITVISYLDLPAEQVDVDGPAEYYRLAADLAAADAAGVLERGVRAGVELGPDPATAVEALVSRALDALDGRDDTLIAVLGGTGMRLTDYLPTRIFELVVHSMDIADATGLNFTPPEPALLAATTLSAQISVTMGRGDVVLRALTGRAPLPQPFSVTA
ncbi:MAG: maleylpyruvate isomerase N-terminal domain-containing protein [Mycobacterium sp.]